MHLLLAESNKQKQKEICDFFIQHQGTPITAFTDAETLLNALPTVSSGVIMLSDQLCPSPSQKPEIMGVALTKTIHDFWQKLY